MNLLNLPTTKFKMLWSILAILLLVGLGTPGYSFAQNGDRIILLKPDTSQFPQVDFYLEAIDAQNNLLPDLQPAGLKVFENGKQRPLTKLDRSEPGLQFIAAINPGSTMGLGSAGRSFYSQIQGTLQGWALAQTANKLNDYSYATNTGLQSIRVKDPKEFANAVINYKVDLLASQVNLNSLNQALDMASDPNPNPLTQRAILYITVPPTPAILTGLPNLASRASQQNVHIFIWLVAPANYANNPAAETLQQMAETTGGQFFLLSGAQPLPDPELYLRSLRYLYHGTYISEIKSPGINRLSVQIDQPDFKASSPEQPFDLAIQAPNPIFMAPPTEILRKPSDSASVTGEPDYQPSDTEIKIIIEFPDGHVRPLKHTRLFADGTLVAENVSAPFDTFNWKLGSYTSSSQHVLKVEVEDQIGLHRSSIEIPVQIQVEKPGAKVVIASLLNNRTLIVDVTLGLTGLLMVAVIFIAGRRTWQGIAKRRHNDTLKDPVSQPIHVRDEPHSRSRRPSAAGSSPSWPRPAQPETGANARLVRLSEDGQPIPSSAIQITHSELTFGSDPQQAICVLESPSVSPLHARLTSASDGTYILADAGSVAGTWLNFAPVSTLGAHLEHNDLIQIGRVSFRFELNKPTRLRQPVVEPYKEDLS